MATFPQAKKVLTYAYIMEMHRSLPELAALVGAPRLTEFVTGLKDRPLAELTAEELAALDQEIIVAERWTRAEDPKADAPTLFAELRTLLATEKGRRRAARREDELAPFIKEYEGLTRERLQEEAIANLERLVSAKDEHQRVKAALDHGSVEEIVAAAGSSAALSARMRELEDRIAALKKLSSSRKP